MNDKAQLFLSTEIFTSMLGKPKAPYKVFYGKKCLELLSKRLNVSLLLLAQRKYLILHGFVGQG